MDLFALPPEIRLKIYAELLVHRGPIPFLGTSWANFKFRRFSEGTELYPTVLRVNRQVFEEAVPLLYAGNCFQFADPDATSAQCHTTIADFIRQIGAQAALLRHVCINFPALPLKQESRLDSLDLLRDACPNIMVLELSLPWERAGSVLQDPPIFTMLLGMIHTRLETFKALKEVKVDVNLLDGLMVEESDDGSDDSETEYWKPHRDSLRQLDSHGWAVCITKVPPPTSHWHNYDIDDGADEYFESLSWDGEFEYEWEPGSEMYFRDHPEMRPDYADDGGPA